MGFWGYDSISERTADMHIKNERRREKERKAQYERAQSDRAEHIYEQRNWENKRVAFDAEQRLAARENRAPRYMSPHEVPDIPRFQEQEPAPEAKSSEPLNLGPLLAIVIGAIAILGIVPAILQHIIMSYGGVFTGVLQFLFSTVQALVWLVLFAAGALALVWQTKKSLADGDPDKLRAARMWNPLNIAQAIVGVAKDLIAERRAKRKL